MGLLAARDRSWIDLERLLMEAANAGTRTLPCREPSIGFSPSIAAGSRDHGNRIWRLLNLELWFRVCVEAEPIADLVQPGSVVAYR